MSSRHLVDPELLVGLEKFPSIEFSDSILPAVREQMATLTPAASTAVLDVEVNERRIEGADRSGIGIVMYTPRGAMITRPAVLYIHGGGYILGSAQMMTIANQRMAVEAGCVVVAVDYRLAPETRHPGPVEDCYTALKWLHRNGSALGVDPDRIAVAGESAGGGLAAALALLARDRGEVAILHQHLIYPMLDDRTCVADPNPYAGEFMWTRTSNHFGWSSLLGVAPGSEGVSPYAAAARAKDLTRLPSTFISVGALDLFAEEDIDYARRLMRAGVPTELHVYPGAYHGFELAADAQVTMRAAHNSLAALRRALHTV